ncbi:16253_t:CDS:2 [Entrophospora sp. SA101]|nr:16253_t:CDS:2 [Entrophospora sp. SA101]
MKKKDVNRNQDNMQEVESPTSPSYLQQHLALAQLLVTTTDIPKEISIPVTRNQQMNGIIDKKPPVYTKWTDKEDELLKEAVQIYGPHKWSLIATHVPNRTPMQCSARWVGALNPSILKGRWTTQEDNALRDAVNQYMMNSIDSQGNPQPIPWNKVSKCIPARTGAQCQARWTEALDPRIKKGKWSPEEDEILKEGVRLYGRCWIRIAEMITGRTQRQCRTRWLQVKNKHTTPSTPAQSIKNVVTSLPSKPSSTSSSLSSSPVFSSPSSSLPSPTSNIQGVIMRSSPTTNNGGNISGDLSPSSLVISHELSKIILSPLKPRFVVIGTLSEIMEWMRSNGNLTCEYDDDSGDKDNNKDYYDNIIKDNNKSNVTHVDKSSNSSSPPTSTTTIFHLVIKPEQLYQLHNGKYYTVSKESDKYEVEEGYTVIKRSRCQNGMTLSHVLRKWTTNSDNDKNHHHSKKSANVKLGSDFDY